MRNGSETEIMNTIISDDLWVLLDRMTEKDVSISVLPDILGKYIPPIAKKLGLHMINYRIDLPESPVKGRVFIDMCPFDDGTGCGWSVESRFVTRENGLMTVTAMVDDEEGRSEFLKLAKLMFSFCGRVITIETLDNAIVTDPLTGAKNVVGLHDFMTCVVKNGNISDYALFLTNIKNFKYLNQKIGMQKGDEILFSVVKRFKETFSDEGTIFRLGADNFVIIILKDYVTSLIQFLKTHETHIGSDMNLHVSFKAGIFLAEKNSIPSDLMNYAAAAYAVAKQGHSGDFVFFEKGMLENEIKTKKIMTAFPVALRNHEFEVYYQPKVRSDDGEIVGCEALCRWVRDGKIVAPLEFIPVIERLGSIVQLDMYVLDRVCSDIKEWIGKGFEPVRTSINISRRCLAVPGFADRIRRTVDSYGIPHELIEIELTETYINDEVPLMKKFISTLKEYKFRIAIDDFGSGYSTITMLKSIEADTIKLDREFIRDISEKRPTDKIIIKNIVNLVHDLKIDIIAEGVESKEQLKLLSESGCNVIQGFYYDKPLPRTEFDERIADHKYYQNKQ